MREPHKTIFDTMDILMPSEQDDFLRLPGEETSTLDFGSMFLSDAVARGLREHGCASSQCDGAELEDVCWILCRLPMKERLLYCFG